METQCRCEIREHINGRNLTTTTVLQTLPSHASHSCGNTPSYQQLQGFSSPASFFFFGCVDQRLFVCCIWQRQMRWGDPLPLHLIGTWRGYPHFIPYTTLAVAEVTPIQPYLHNYRRSPQSCLFCSNGIIDLAVHVHVRLTRRS